MFQGQQLTGIVVGVGGMGSVGPERIGALPRPPAFLSRLVAGHADNAGNAEKID